ncbi:MAG TPA: type VI secretion system-associated protein TagF [Acetobacteraceae bacterium]|nr:type VI secretion system-associated protein TagF [Acetobacteraceae bacterium]
MPSAVASAVSVGFYGKLPARGDFVQAGLSRDFTDPWHAWLQTVIAGSRTIMGESWLPAFLEAPVWRFALTDGLCGKSCVLGLMLPSVDRVGRYFPLTIAALATHPLFDEASADAWLDQCETIGRLALDEDAPPERLTALLSAADAPGEALPRRGSVWWSEGGPRVPAGRFTLGTLPDSTGFAGMLGAGHETAAASGTINSEESAAAATEER